MINRKNFNNLFDSICLTLLLLFLITFYCLMLWFAVIHPSEGTNPIAALIVSTILFGVFIAGTFFCMIAYCYEYWIINKTCICSKKLFRRQIIIDLKDIEKVEKKVVHALVLGIYRSDAYVISSKQKKITILINERKVYTDLESVIIQFFVR